MRAIAYAIELLAKTIVHDSIALYEAPFPLLVVAVNSNKALTL